MLTTSPPGAERPAVCPPAEAARLYRQWLPLARKVADVFLRRHHAGRQLTRDLRQEAQEALWDAARKYRPGVAEFSTFAWCSIWRRMGRLYGREGQRRRAWGVSLSDLSAGRCHDGRPGPPPEYEPEAPEGPDAAETADLFGHALALLAGRPRHQEAVALYYGRGLVLKGVAREMHVTPQRAQQLVSEGLALLRERMRRP